MSQNLSKPTHVLVKLDGTFCSKNLETGEILPITVGGAGAKVHDPFRVAPIPKNGFKLGVNCTSIYQGEDAPW